MLWILGIFAFAGSAQFLHNRALREGGFSFLNLGAIVCLLGLLAVFVHVFRGTNTGFGIMPLFLLLSQLAEVVSSPFDQDQPRIPLMKQAALPKQMVVLCWAVVIFVIVFAGLAVSNAFGFGDILATGTNRLLEPLTTPAHRQLTDTVLALFALVVMPVSAALRHLEKNPWIFAFWLTAITVLAWTLCLWLHLDIRL